MYFLHEAKAFCPTDTKLIKGCHLTRRVLQVLL